jgi:hypothetical protein
VGSCVKAVGNAVGDSEGGLVGSWVGSSVASVGNAVGDAEGDLVGY